MNLYTEVHKYKQVGKWLYVQGGKRFTHVHVHVGTQICMPYTYLATKVVL